MQLNDLMQYVYARLRLMFLGLRAVVVQPFTELNVKTGSQFSASSFVTLPAGSSAYIAFVTGSKPCILKGRDIQVQGGNVRVRVFKDAPHTQQLAIPVYGQNDIFQNTKTVTLYEASGVNLTGLSPTFSPRYFLAAVGSNQTPASPSSGVTGLETILAPNTVYIQELTSLNTSGDINVEFFATWYEGVIEEI